MTGPYQVRVWDNFQFMEAREARDGGLFATYEEALQTAMKIVERSVLEQGFDFRTYSTYGEDPVILAPPGDEHPAFSAWEYAKELCERHHQKV